MGAGAQRNALLTALQRPNLHGVYGDPVSGAHVKLDADPSWSALRVPLTAEPLVLPHGPGVVEVSFIEAAELEVEEGDLAVPADSPAL